MRRSSPLLSLCFLVFALASMAHALLPPPDPVRFGATVPPVNRYSPESDWAQTGGLAAYSLGGRTARLSAVMWSAYPEGFRGGQVDTGQYVRQMEVARGTSGTLVLLFPSEFPVSGGWIPPKESWPAALIATKRAIAEFDGAAKRFGMSPPKYQLWNETSPNKPGGGKSGRPGEFAPELHEYLAYLAKGLGIVPGSAAARRFVGPAYSNLTDGPDAALEELASGSSKDGFWERRVAPALHLRLSGPGLTPEQYEPRVTEIINRNVDLVRSLPYWRGQNPDVWITEAYVTPGDIGRPDLKESEIGAWKAAALRGAARSKAYAFLPYGLADNVDEGGGANAWLKYGGWGQALSGSKIESFAKTVDR